MTSPRRTLATLTATGLAAAALTAVGLATAPPASAAPQRVDQASLVWEINDEVDAGAFAPGTWNLLSAGTIGNPGEGGQTLTSADSGATWGNGKAAGWRATDGDVTVQDLGADGSWAPATFQGTRTNSAGVPASAFTTARGETRVSLTGGEGVVDRSAGTASIRWEGDVTVLFYSGMTYSTFSDPVLTVAADGTARLSATASAFATSMDDSEKWTALPATPVTLASMSGVSLAGDTFTAQPTYRQVTYNHAEGETAQNRDTATWGAFPTDFVQFQQKVGQGPYWYSTGSSADPRKPALPLSVDLGPTRPQGTVSASATSFPTTGAHQVTVTGTGFDPAAATATRPPLAGKPAGVYVVVGKVAETWRPSDGAASATRKGSDTRWAVRAEDMTAIGGAERGAVELRPDGSFATTLTVDQAAIDALATDPALTRYGIFTYAGGGATQAAYETFTPVTFADAPVTPPTTPTTPTTPVTPAGPSVPAVPGRTSSQVSVAKVRAPSARRAGRAVVTLAGSATGTVKTVLRTAKGAKVRSQAAKAEVRSGRAVVRLPRLRPGRYVLSVRWAGSSTSLPSSTTTKIRVR